MILFLSIYVILGLIWYFLTLTAYGMGSAFGGSQSSIPNWTFRTFHDWVYPKEGISVKVVIGAPLWTLLWPISLSSSLISVYFQRNKV